jgi:hypothetical protein
MQTKIYTDSTIGNLGMVNNININSGKPSLDFNDLIKLVHTTKQQISTLITQYQEGKINAATLENFVKDLLEDVKNMFHVSKVLNKDVTQAIGDVEQALSKSPLPEKFKSFINEVLEKIKTTNQGLSIDLQKSDAAINEIEQNLAGSNGKVSEFAEKVIDFLNTVASTIDGIGSILGQFSAFAQMLANLANKHPGLHKVLEAISTFTAHASQIIDTIGAVISHISDRIKQFFT